MSKLAIHGGTPVRREPLPPNYPGAVVLGEAESASASAVIRAKSPFRYYGPELQNAVRRLEENMCETLQIPYALGVSSGTAALIVALRAIGVGYGDKVIIPANTFIATAGAVLCCNAVPVFVDIDESLNIDPNDLGRVYDEEVKAIIAVPIIGTPCDMEPIMSFARKHGIHVIEDVAQSCGVQYKGKYQGTIGDVGAFSFQMNKIITAGEGGAIVTRSPGFFERAVRYHDQGSFRDKARYGLDTQDELHAFAGQNYRMSEVTGAIMLEQWGKLDFIVNRMRSHYKKIREALAREIPSLKFRKSPDEEGNLGSNLGMIMPDAETAKQFSEALNAENINSFTLYSGKPVYKQPQLFYQRTVEKDNFPYNYPFKKPVIYKEGLCPAAEDLLPRTIFVSLSPILADSDVTEIIEGIVKVYKGLHVEELTEKLQAE